MTPTTRDELVEILANGTSDEGTYLGYDVANDILHAIERSGCVVVPITPTDKMWDIRRNTGTARIVYHAMLAASPFIKEK